MFLYYLFQLENHDLIFIEGTPAIYFEGAVERRSRKNIIRIYPVPNSEKLLTHNVIENVRKYLATRSDIDSTKGIYREHIFSLYEGIYPN